MSDQTNWTMLRKEQYKILKNLKPTGEILDLGAGDGRFNDLLPPHDSVDIKPYEGVTIIADLEQPLKLDKKYDVILAMNTLEHIFNSKELCKGAYEHLNAGGRFIGSVPFMVEKHQEPIDFWRYTDHGLKRMLTEAGFSVYIMTIGTTYDSYKLTQQHLFSGLLDYWRPHSMLATIFVKILWNLEKILTKPSVLKQVTNGKSPLGYFFIAQKVL